MRALATSVLAATDPDRITLLQFLGLLAAGLAATAMGVLHWTGRLKPDARYQTFYGGMAAGIPGGLGWIVIAIGLGLRDGVGKPVDWGPWWVISIIGASLAMIGFLYMVVYYWFGVPNFLRPRPQRGQPKPRPLLRRGRT
ncbi:MAG: hypothetical protein ACRD0U_09445 [Acidimicrobiales bacterium]